MLKIGDKFPEFSLTAVINNDSADAFQQIQHDSHDGKWLVVFFWPYDFTFVCPTELAEFAKLHNDFKQRDAEILGVSVDSEYVHLAWRNQHKDLKDLPYPMLSDSRRELSSALGIVNQQTGVAERATYIVDPDGVIRFAMMTDVSVGRNTKEVLRVLDALQSDGLCACNWQKGDATINVSSG